MLTVITGGAGFVGTAVAHRLLRDASSDGEIVLVDSLARHGASLMLKRLLDHPRVSLICADLTESSSLANLPMAVDRVYHLAAVVGVGSVLASPDQVMRVNTLSTIHVFEWFIRAARPGARLVFASSSEVYSGALQAGLPIPIPTPENVPLVISEPENLRFSYAASKLWGEFYARSLSARNGSVLATVRYHNVYGPGMGYDHVIPQVISRVTSREEPFQMIGVKETRSFCWIGDAVEATHRVMEAPGLGPGMVVHIGDEVGEIEIGRLYEMIFELCGWWPKERIYVSSATGSVQRRCPAVARLRALTGYEPRTPLHEGLEKTVAWYLDHLSQGRSDCNRNSTKWMTPS